MRKIALTVLVILLLACPAIASSTEDNDKKSLAAEGTLIQADGDARTTVQNDLLSINLVLEKEGAVPVQLHEEMQKEASAALNKAQKVATVKLKTTGYSVYPVYERERIVRQHATYQFSLESKDFDAGLTLAADMLPFQISNLSFSVSPELRKETEKTLLEEAISDLRGNFAIAASSLGAKDIKITNLTIGTRQYNPVQPRLMKEAMAMNTAAPVAAEAGESQVNVTVSGSAQVK